MALFCCLESRWGYLEKTSYSVVMLSGKVCYRRKRPLESPMEAVQCPPGLLSLSLSMQISCNKQNHFLLFLHLLEYILIQPVSFFFSSLLFSFRNVWAVSTISCIALRAVDDLIHKEYTASLMLLRNMHMKCASPTEGQGATPHTAYWSLIQ